MKHIHGTMFSHGKYYHFITYSVIYVVTSMKRVTSSFVDVIDSRESLGNERGKQDDFIPIFCYNFMTNCKQKRIILIQMMSTNTSLCFKY